MKAVSIARRLKTGLGGLASAILVLALAAVGSALYLEREFALFRTEIEVTKAANDVAEDIYEAQLAAFAYRSSGASALIEEFEDNMDEVEIEVERLLASDTLSDELRGRLERVRSGSVAFSQAFADVTALDRRRAAEIAEFEDLGNAAQASLSTLMDASNRAGDAGQTFSAARVQQSMFDAKVEAALFVLTGRQEALDAAVEQFAAARQQLSWMATMAGDPQRADLIADVRGMLSTLLEMSGALQSVTFDREEAFARMSDSKDLILGEAEQVVESVNVSLAETGDIMDTTFEATWIGLGGAAILALVFALVTTRRTIGRVTEEFGTTLRIVSELADGRTDIDIPGRDHQTELGDIARALEVFRLKAREADALSRQSTADRARAERERERHEAEAAEAERRKQAAEAEAAERRKKEIFDALRAAVSGVVAAAAAGDFSQRVDTTALEPELRTLADEINRLMANVEAGLAEIAKVSERLAAGDLRQGMSGEFEGTFKALQSNIDAMIGSLGELLGEVSHEALLVSQQSAEMTRGAEDLSRRAENQAASLEETSASMTQIASSAESNAASAADTDSAASKMNAEAGRAKNVLQSTIAAMRDIEDGSKEIEAIVDVIEDIAFQTNLLSLNASVEAARAGEAGKGFAVVANEVRALAQRSAEASSKVQAIISQSTSAISRGSEAVEQTGEALEQIVTRIGTVSSNLREIKASSDEQATAVKDISNAFAELDKITQKNAAIAEQTRGTAGLLATQSQRMQEAIAKVRLRSQATARAMSSPRSDQPAA